MAIIKCGNCHSTHETVAACRACYGFAPSATTVTEAHGHSQSGNVNPVATAKPVAKPVSEKQVSFIAKLTKERDLAAGIGTDNMLDVVYNSLHQGEDNIDAVTSREASGAIEFLLALPKIAKASSHGSPAGDPEDGIYIVEVDGQEDRIYKVYAMVHGSGRQGLKRLVTDGTTGSFAYLGLAAKHLPEAARLMTLEEAKKFGRIYGFCVRCGATLTDEGSIADGIGPVCGKKGWHAAPAIAL